MMKSYRLKLESQSKIDWRKKGGGIESCYGRLTCHEHLENSSRLGLLNDHDPGSHIGVVQSDRLVSKSVTNAWLQFVYVSKRTFSSNILLQHFSFPLQFFILHSTNKEADDAQVNRKGSGLKSRLANQTRSVVWWWWSNLTSVFTGVVPNAELSVNRLLSSPALCSSGRGTKSGFLSSALTTPRQICESLTDKQSY